MSSLIRGAIAACLVTLSLLVPTTKAEAPRPIEERAAEVIDGLVIHWDVTQCGPMRRVYRQYVSIDADPETFEAVTYGRATEPWDKPRVIEFVEERYMIFIFPSGPMFELPYDEAVERYPSPCVFLWPEDGAKLGTWLANNHSTPTSPNIS